jgi:hypothetical protein
MAMSALALPASTVPAVLLANTSNKVSSVSVGSAALPEATLALALLLAMTVVSSDSSKVSSVYEPELELTALVDADAEATLEVVSCAQAALMARAQAMVTRKSCMLDRVFCCGSGCWTRLSSVQLQNAGTGAQRAQVRRAPLSTSRQSIVIMSARSTT